MFEGEEKATPRARFLPRTCGALRVFCVTGKLCSCGFRSTAQDAVRKAFSANCPSNAPCGADESKDSPLHWRGRGRLLHSGRTRPGNARDDPSGVTAL